MFDLIISLADYRTTPGLYSALLQRVLDNSNLNKDRLYEEFTAYIAELYRDKLKEFIDTQKFKDMWIPLSNSYLAYKKKKGYSLKIWEATGHLKNSIIYWRRRSTFMVGVHGNKIYPGTDLKVRDVVLFMEYGTTKMPARPLFRPTVSYIRQHMPEITREFIRSHGYQKYLRG